MPHLQAIYAVLRGHLPGASGLIQCAIIIGAIYLLIGRDIDALTATVAEHGDRIEVLERRVLGSYDRNGTMYQRRQCLAMKRENVRSTPASATAFLTCWRSQRHEDHRADSTQWPVSVSSRLFPNRDP